MERKVTSCNSACGCWLQVLGGGSQAAKQVMLLPLKRHQNVGVLLRRLKVTPNQVGKHCAKPLANLCLVPPNCRPVTWTAELLLLARSSCS